MVFDENSVITAEEARARTWSSISEASNTQLQNIIEKINEAIDNGEYRYKITNETRSLSACRTPRASWQTI